ncbi:Foldase protein PrsA [Chitinispirillum alkaliphilum]|nr:Foldase protein PrsA [Chitinispirillum alkaliphilum]
MKLLSSILAATMIFAGSSMANPQLLDGIAAVVGDEVILISELEAFTMMRMEQMRLHETPDFDMEQFRSEVLEDLINNKVLLVNAKRDSTLAISDEEVEGALNNHISTILQQNNITLSQLERELKNQQGTTLPQFRAEMREAIREQLIQQRMQQFVYHSLNVTRRDVERFYEKYQDKLPQFGQSIQLSKLSLSVKPSDELEEAVFTKIHDIRQQLINGGDFDALAREYSEGPEASAGGELGLISKGTISERAFEDRAFNLPVGQISQPFRTRLGYHIIEVLEKRDRGVRVRQIFLKVAPDEEEVGKITSKLDSIRQSAQSSEEFSQAVREYSTDRITRDRGGNMGWSTLSDLPSSVRSAVRDLEKGQITEPVVEQNTISIYRVEDTADSRKLSLEDDYSVIAEQCREYKARKKLIEKVESWRQDTFIDIRI